MTTLRIDKIKSYSVDRVVSPQKTLMNPIVEKINQLGIVVDNTLASKIEHLKYNLFANIRAQESLQDSMTYLDEKEENLTKLKNLGDTLLELSTQYLKASPYTSDRSRIVTATDTILEEIEYITGKIDSKSIDIISSTGRGGSIYSDPLKIILTPYPYSSESNFIKDYDTEEILAKAAIIKDSIVTPVNTLIDQCQNYKSSLYNQFLEENSISQYNTTNLYNQKNLSYYMWNNLIKTQEALLESVTSLRFQTYNLNPDNVYELLK